MDKKKNFKILISTFLIFCSFYVGVNATKECKNNLTTFKKCYTNIKQNNNSEKTKSNLNKSCPNIKTNIEFKEKLSIENSKNNKNLQDNNINKPEEKSNELKPNSNIINTQKNHIKKTKKEEPEKGQQITKSDLKNALFKKGIRKQNPTLDFRVTNSIFYTQPGPYKFNNINKNLDEYRKEIEEDLKKNDKEQEVIKLQLYYYYFMRLFKIFDANCKEINRINNLFKTKTIFKGKEDDFYSYFEGKDRLYQIYQKNIHPNYNKRTTESMYSMCLENFIKYYVEQSVNSYFTQQGINIEQDKIEEMLKPIQNQANTLHEKVIFDIDTINNYLWIRLKKMLDCIDIINKLYEKYLKFINNIKNKDILNYRFVERVLYFIESKKIEIHPGITNKPKYNLEKEYFNHKDAAGKLSQYVYNIVEYTTNHPNPTIKFMKLLPETEQAVYIKQKQDYEEYSNFIRNFRHKYEGNSKDCLKCPVLESIKIGIELRKEIAKVMEKLVQQDLYKKIFKSITTIAKRENEIINNITPMLLFKLPNPSDDRAKANEITNLLYDKIFKLFISKLEIFISKIEQQNLKNLSEEDIMICTNYLESIIKFLQTIDISINITLKNKITILIEKLSDIIICEYVPEEKTTKYEKRKSFLLKTTLQKYFNLIREIAEKKIKKTEYLENVCCKILINVNKKIETLTKMFENYSKQFEPLYEDINNILKRKKSEIKKEKENIKIKYENLKQTLKCLKENFNIIHTLTNDKNFYDKLRQQLEEKQNLLNELKKSIKKIVKLKL